MENRGPHVADLCDSRMQVTILTLPPNCTSMYQPMDMGVIAALKLHYRSLLLNRITSTVEHRSEVRRAAQHLKAGTRSLDEVYDPHMLDATELVGQAWEKIGVATIARCWIESKILPTEVQEALIMKHGQPRVREDVRRKRDELDRLADILKKLQLDAPAGSDIADELVGVEINDVESRVEVEEDGEVREALVNGVLEGLEEVRILDSEVPPSPGKLEYIGNAEDRVDEIPLPSEVKRAFRDVEDLAQRTGVLVAADGLRKANRTLVDAFGEQNKRKRTQPMIHEFFTV